MKVLQINSVCGCGSTGKICISISRLASSKGIDNKIIYFTGESNYEFSEKISNIRYLNFQSLKSHILGNYGFNSKLSTKKAIQRIKDYNPDIVHIHNIHGHEINFSILFDFLKGTRIKVIYTFHDCWAFTGYCPYFTLVKCNKWKSFCHGCPLRKRFSWFFDKSRRNFEKKKKAFKGIDLTIVTPSFWLANIVKESFLSKSTIKTIHNGIDLNVFRPVNSSFKANHGINDKYVVLGVADSWDERKGLDAFVELSKRLPDNYQIVLVGTNNRIDKLLPFNIISIHRTNNQSELVELYSSADVFVNPTREENYPTVNMEALACGTPVITFRTGGSPEMIDDSCGSIIDCNDYESLYREIIRICKSKPYSQKNCLMKAKSFDMNESFNNYIELYKAIIGKH